MGWDFELALVAATAVCGSIWAVHAVLRRLVSAPGQGRVQDGPAKATPTVVEYARSFFPVLLLVLVVRSFVAEPFRIPSQSMLPTLQVGDFIVVNKFTYGLRLPVLHWELVDFGEPERGDVIVFRYPPEPSVNYIKRVVGVPGDRIAYYNRRVLINGEPVELERVGEYAPPGGGGVRRLIELRERLGEKMHSLVLDPNGESPEGEFVVPEDQYFVLGDNRDHSNDSRRWGYVPASNLVGKAELIWMHWSWSGNGLDWDRIGQSVD
jgi:signal peptidase I